MLELFKGSGSVGKVAKRMGWDVVSLDNLEKFKPDILSDILKWDYKSFKSFIPDFIWASPPCNTYSKLSYPLKERHTTTAQPYSDRAKEGTKILAKTIEIIKYFKKLNPQLKFVIENPTGMMRHDPLVKNLIRNTTFYSLYGDKRLKETDFFSNIDLQLKHDRTKAVSLKKDNITDIPLIERYKIPTKLTKHILSLI